MYKKIMQLIGIGVLSSCNTPITSETVMQHHAIPISEEEVSALIGLETINIQLPTGHSIGKVQLTGQCVNAEDFRVRMGRYELNDKTFTDIFRKELQDANYNFIGEPGGTTIDDAEQDNARYLIAGLVTEIKANVCYPNIDFYGRAAIFSNPNESMGGAFVKIDWLVYDTRSQQTVYELSSEGSSKLSKPTDGSVNQVLELAFSVAVKNLLSKQKFHDLMVINGAPTIVAGHQSLEH